jgi:hypothetical protein
MHGSSALSQSWRQWLRIHSATELFLLLDRESLDAPAATDIKKHGLKQRISAGRDVPIVRPDHRERFLIVPLSFAADIAATAERGMAQQP